MFFYDVGDGSDECESIDGINLYTDTLLTEVYEEKAILSKDMILEFIKTTDSEGKINR